MRCISSTHQAAYVQTEMRCSAQRLATCCVQGRRGLKLQTHLMMQQMQMQGRGRSSVTGVRFVQSSLLSKVCVSTGSTGVLHGCNLIHSNKRGCWSVWSTWRVVTSLSHQRAGATSETRRVAEANYLLMKEQVGFTTL